MFLSIVIQNISRELFTEKMLCWYSIVMLFILYPGGRTGSKFFFLVQSFYMYVAFKDVRYLRDFELQVPSCSKLNSKDYFLLFVLYM